MTYRLVVLTHGEGATLERTLLSFHEHVTPKPADYVCIRDGGGKLPPINPDGQTWRGSVLQPQQGFCAATRAAWKAATLPGPDFVFWLEHDFTFRRDIDLRPIMETLLANPLLAQMQFMRGPVSVPEKRAGGLYESRPGEYSQAFTNLLSSAEAYPYLEHRSYLTTNPSLMRRAWMAAHSWPPPIGKYAEQCEGKFSIDLVERGFKFGVWGAGEPWVDHIGERDGFGY